LNYKRALIAARNGKAVLFVGAGFSVGAKTLHKDPLPTGGQLAEKLCREAGATITNDLKLATTRFLKKKSPEQLVELLKIVFTVSSVSDVHRGLANIPWKAVYTTNYDNVIERAGADVGKKFTPLTLSKNPRNQSAANSVLHINGFVDELDTDALNNSFKLTNTSYLTQQFRHSPWSEVFIRDVQAAHAVFFVGYSLYDLDIQEILYSDDRLKEKTFFIQRSDLTDEEKEDSDLSDFGEIFPIGLDSFLNGLNNVDPLAISADELLLTSFSELSVSNSPISDIRDDDLYSLLLRGEIKNDILTNRILTNKREDYILERDAEAQVLSGIKNFENIIIHGDLANGKTVLTRAICAKLIGEGFRVFQLRDEAYDCFDEIEQIVKHVNKPIIIFENYTGKLSLVGHANIKRNSSTKLILTARTIEHDRSEEELYYSRSLVSPKSTIEICVNKLSSKDLDKFSALLEMYGLWGEMASMSKKNKIQHLEQKCNSELHGILLGVLNSPQVRDRIKPLFAEMIKSEPMMMAMVSAFALSIINIGSPTVHMIAALSDDSSIFSPLFKNNAAAKQFLNSSHGVVVPKSSVMAEFALKNFPDASLLIRTLVEICKNARRKADGNRLYFDIYKDLASFRYAQKMLPEAGRRESLIAFYEGLRSIDEERRNPHFWLQYAIARLTFPDENNLIHAKQYLDTGLSLAKERQSYWTTDLETQYARYLLEHAINVVEDSDNAFAEFCEADALLKAITKKEKYKKEAYRPVRLYEPFFKKFKSKLDQKAHHRILSSCKDLITNIGKLPYRTRYDATVVASLDGLKNISKAIEKKA
jgi:hypothetical protein